MDRGFLIASAAAAGLAYFVYQEEKKDDKTGLNNSFTGVTKPIPPVPGAYQCQNNPNLFVLPGYVYGNLDGIVVSTISYTPWDDHATPISFPNGFSYWFRQGITPQFLSTCPAPQ